MPVFVRNEATMIPCASCAEKEKSDRLVAGLLRADARGTFNRQDENFSIADLPSLGGLDDRFHRGRDLIIRQHEFKFDLGEKIHRVFAAAINFRVPLLAAEAFDFGDRHAFDADAGQCFFDLFQFERFDDGLNFFHDEDAILRPDLGL